MSTVVNGLNYSAAAAAVCPLFYYRMTCVIPRHHPFRKKWIQCIVYGLFYGLGNIIPIPLTLLATRCKSQMEWKMESWQIYKIDYEGFWSPNVVAIRAEGNPWKTVAIGFILFACAVLVICVFGCSLTIYRTVKTSKRNISARDRKEHISVLISLMPLVSSFYPLASARLQ